MAQAAARPDPMLPRLYRVLEAWPETPSVISFEIAPAEQPAAPFAPGQFNMLYAFGIGEAAISISGTGGSGGPVHTIRRVGAVTGALAALGPGAALGVRGPYGTGWPTPARGRHLLFVAGGLGLAPIRPALEAAIARQADYAGITLLVGTRSPGELLYAYQLADWAAADRTRLLVTVDVATQGWAGSVGVVTTRLDAALRGTPPGEVTALVCGPEIMMRHTCRELADRGVPGNEIFVSMERNMKCAIGLCGHCQWGPDFVCRDGPVFAWDRIGPRLDLQEL